MKKAIYLLPAVLFSAAVIAMCLILRTIVPLWFLWAVLLWLGSRLLSKGKWWGSLVGLIPAVHMICMSTKQTGQTVNIEFPLGITIAVCYLLLGLLAWRKSAKLYEK